MPDPAWVSSPPEVNYLRLTGAGAGGTATTVASGAAWQTLAAGGELAATVSATNADCTSMGFQGVGGAASAILAAELNSALHLLTGWAAEKTGIAAAAVDAYMTAVSAMIPAEVSLANRAEQAADTAINPMVFGSLTPAIVALDITYFGEFWPHNASVGAGYGAALAGLTLALSVPPPTLLDQSPAAGPVVAAQAVGDSVGRAAARESVQGTNLADRSGASPPAALTDAAVGSISGMAPALNSFSGVSQQAPGGLLSPIQALTGLSTVVSSPAPYDDEGSGLDGVHPASPLSALSAPIIGLPAGVAGGPALGGSVGAGSSGIGSAAALTAYDKPATAFAAEARARPSGLKVPDAEAGAQRTPATAGIGAVPTPMSSKSKSADGQDGAVRVRVVLHENPATTRTGEST